METAPIMQPFPLPVPTCGPRSDCPLFRRTAFSRHLRSRAFSMGFMMAPARRVEPQKSLIRTHA